MTKKTYNEKLERLRFITNYNISRIDEMEIIKIQKLDDKWDSDKKILLKKLQRKRQEQDSIFEKEVKRLEKIYADVDGVLK